MNEELASLRPPDETVIWRSYVANTSEICKALNIPAPSSASIDIELHDAGIRITVKTLGDSR